MVLAYLTEVYNILLELSPSLLLGLLLAGILQVYLPKGLIQRRLSRNNTRSVLEAVLLGVPMPLCSCGVVPTAIGLRNGGASKGAATGFLISTPQTGLDSILVSASFLGWPFALFKVVAAFVTGMIGGLLVNATEKAQPVNPLATLPEMESDSPQKRHPFDVLRYAVFDLLAAIDLWLIVGILLAALIGWLVPDGALSDMTWTQGIGGMLIALAFSMPLYVCTTGSVPIAASLIAAGMPLGTALVFLMAGPATNIATMSIIYRALGKRVLAIYLGVVALMSMLFGLFFQWVLGAGAGTSVQMQHSHHESDWLAMASAAILVFLLALLSVQRLQRRFSVPIKSQGDTGLELILNVEGMSCQHCVATVKKTLEAQPGVQQATPDLNSGRVAIEGENLDGQALAQVVEKAGYKASL